MKDWGVKIHDVPMVERPSGRGFYFFGSGREPLAALRAAAEIKFSVMFPLHEPGCRPGATGSRPRLSGTLRTSQHAMHAVAPPFEKLSGRNHTLKLAGLVALLFVTFTAKSASAADHKLVLAMLNSATQTPYYVAVESGLYKQYGLDIEFRYSSRAAHKR